MGSLFVLSSNYMAALIDHLVNEKYYNENQIMAFTYDWRQPTTFGSVPQALAAMIGEYCATTGLPLDIISHGTGGLIVNAALVNYVMQLPGGGSCVNRWITAGTPFLGSHSLGSVMPFVRT